MPSRHALPLRRRRCRCRWKPHRTAPRLLAPSTQLSLFTRVARAMTSWWKEAAAVILNTCAAPGAEERLLAPAGDPPARLTLAQANAMPDADFRSVFANIVECCPEVAAALAPKRPFGSVPAVAEAAAAFLEALPEAVRLRVLLLHPDLAGRLARRGLLTAESQREQQAAGVLRLPPGDAQRLALLTARYRERFGFPYVVCAREKATDQILENLEARVERSREEELRTGIDEVKKICRLRLKELLSDD